MASMAHRARNWWLAGCMAVLSAGTPPAGAAVTGEPVAEALFDLPALPLDEALARYDALTHLSVFFASALVEGRRSAALRGRHAPAEALHRLLEGSGLQARAVAPDAFVLQPAAATVPRAAPAAEANAGRANPDNARVQAALLRALCAREDLALGSYRLALRVHIDGAGRVAQARLLDTTGDARRDAAVVAAVARADLAPPPADPHQPFVVLLRAQPADAPPVCTAQP
ncbi:STN domain-containing protein [Variovorax sp. LT1R16]|uniref:STN domain-containing protein n=1 Tax=Variovorax sp. LT1R16 TaxID=3443728 RepID=UPI003F452FAA